VTLTTFQLEHLRVVFDEHAPRLFGPMLEASRAHVVMLAERGLVPQERAARLLRGLNQLASRPPEPFVYDGSVEDIYFTVEKRLAAASGVATSDLDVQLARSRNDLDAGVFRMVLRADLLRVIDEVLRAATAALDAADRYADIVVTGYTHRRPAQPTTIGHVLAGYAEALAGEAIHYADVLEQVNRSPLGSCAFAGTDLDIDPPRLAELLGFDGIVLNSYEAVAGADHLIRVATVNAQSLATGARLARTLMDWLTWRWIVTPPEFTQGSSIMPQKRNPVVLEHMVSMAGAAAGDAATVLNNIGAAWWEDSNNATTDVQSRLWDTCDRAQRFFALLAGLLEALESLDPPSSEEIVRSGATTTAAADALSRHGVPFRAAHTVVGRLVRDRAPTEWTPQDVRSAEEAVGVGGRLEDAAVEELLRAAADPTRVVDRAQVDGPGAVAVRGQVQVLRRKFEAVSQRCSGVRDRVQTAATRLDEAVAARVAP
jgi:argininosuccinate lyase